MSAGFYVLDGVTPRPATIHEWTRWSEANDAARIVARDELAPGVTISTVFIGVAPDLYETMVFGPDATLGEVAERTWGYDTRDAALAGHAAACAMALAILAAGGNG